MSKQSSILTSLLTVASLTLFFAVPSARASCGDDILESPAEQCDGGACCQADCTFAPAQTVCRAAVAPACDVAEICSGSDAACPPDVLVGCVDDDAIACTVPACSESGQCITVDNCVQTCRGPGYWSTHSGNEHAGSNVGQSVIDAAGPLLVCGQSIGLTSDIGTLGSALEALCVQIKGVKQRLLYRQLVTAALNCAVSEGGTCDQILNRFVDVSFSDCSALCAGNPVENGPALRQCKSQLACFNDGGRLVDGRCAHGTCASAPDTVCEGQYDPCPNIGADPQACVLFANNCASSDICNQDLDAPAQICPAKKRASSPKACKGARFNSCTIDSCAG